MTESIRARLGPFVEAGQIEALPSPWQVRAAGFVMLPITLSETERERRLSRRTLRGQIPIRVPLQLLFNPRQIWPDTGIGQPLHGVVRHLLSVFHEPAFLGYDLQLLASHPGGLTRLAEEARAVAKGDRRGASWLTAMVGGAGYHSSLCDAAVEAMEGRLPDPLDVDPRFATLLGFTRFCLTLPDWPASSFYGFDFASRR
ncbi:MAG: hypothetical protein AB8I08_12870 [Sandaracinaceae bacterium]